MSLMEMGIHGVVSVEVETVSTIAGTSDSVTGITIKTKAGQEFNLSLFADRPEFLVFKKVEA